MLFNALVGVDFPYASGEPVPVSGNSLNIRVPIVVVPQYLPQNEDVLGKIRLFDKAVGPNSLKQFVLFENVPAAL